MSRWMRGLLVSAVALAVMLPVIAIAGDRFNDVPDSDPFHTDIGWLADAGVTAGCNPPDNDEFCPEDPVKRKQMAAFMRRFAAYLGAEDGIVDAADDADTVDGLDSTALVAKDEADSVTPAMQTAEPGIASAHNPSADGPIITTTPTAVLEVTITVPADGYVQVHGNGYFDIDHTTGSPDLARVWISDVATSSFENSVFYVEVDADHPTDAGLFAGFSTSTVAAVSAGEHTFYLIGDMFTDSGGDDTIDRARLTAVFFPSSYGDVADLQGASADGDSVEG